jgi:guanylate kinase
MTQPLPLVRRGVGLVIAGPSGVGKTAITRGLLQAEPEISLSVSVTTRTPRPGEREGVDYFFRDAAAFEALISQGELLEWAEVYGRRYGTPRAPVAEALAAGRDVVFDIDWQGHRKLRAALPGDIVGIFVLPASRAVLTERLARRGDGEAVIAARMQGASAEMAHWAEFDHVLVNRDLAESVSSVRAILQAARLQTARQPGLAAFVAGLDERRPRSGGLG